MYLDESEAIKHKVMHGTKGDAIRQHVYIVELAHWNTAVKAAQENTRIAVTALAGGNPSGFLLACLSLLPCLAVYYLTSTTPPNMKRQALAAYLGQALALHL